MKGPSTPQMLAVADLQHHLRAATLLVLHEGPPPRDHGDRLHGQVRELLGRVQGNRGDARVTWSDLRLVLAGSLRIMLSEIDNHCEGV